MQRSQTITSNKLNKALLFSAVSAMALMVSATADAALISTGDTDTNATANANLFVGSFETYLRTEPGDFAGNARAWDLGALNISSGDSISISPYGAYDTDFNPGDTDFDQTDVIAVFSSSSTLLDSNQQNRVTGAVSSGLAPVVTPNTPNDGLATDISEDFLVSALVNVTVPTGATHLFFSANDTFFSNNADLVDNGLGVSVSILGQEDLLVGINGVGTATIDGGTQESRTSTRIGLEPGADGTLTVTGAGSRLDNGNSIFVGEEGTGTLNVESGAEVTAQSYGAIGNAGGATGTANVDGTGSRLEIENGNLVIGDGFVGMGGFGTVDAPTEGILNVTNGGAVEADFIDIGNRNGAETLGNGFVEPLDPTNGLSEGTVTVDGSGSTMTSEGLTVGRAGDGTLNVQNNGTVTTRDMTISTMGGSTGDVNVNTGGTLNLDDAGGFAGLVIGNQTNTNATLDVTAGGTVTVGSASNTGAGIDVGRGGGTGTANVSDAGSNLTVTSDGGSSINVGQNTGSTGTLSVSNGATVTVDDISANGGSNLSVGSNGGTGDSTISGAGSNVTLQAAGTGYTGVNIGNNGGGDGTLTVEDGGTLVIGTGTNAGGGYTVANGQSTGVSTVTGPNSSVALTTNGGFAGVNIGIGTGANGTQTVSDGGSITVENTGGGNASFNTAFDGATGSTTVTGAGSQISVTAAGSFAGMEIGSSGTGGDASNGTLLVENGGAVNVGNGTSQNASLTAGNNFNNSLNTQTGTATITGPGSSVTVSATGFSGVTAGSNALADGTINVQSGGALIVESTGGNDDATFDVGRNGATGTANVAGAGTTVDVRSNGRNANVHVGFDDGSDGTLDVNSGAMLNVGDGSTNRANVFVAAEGGTGRAVISGPGTTMNVRAQAGSGNAHLTMARNDGDDGQLTIYGGADVNIGSNVENFAALDVGTADSSATATIAGASTTVDVNSANASNLNVATNFANSGGGTGDLTVFDGAVVTLGDATDNFTNVTVGQNIGSTGTLTVTGAGSAVRALGVSSNGNFGVENGTANVNVQDGGSLEFTGTGGNGNAWVTFGSNFSTPANSGNATLSIDGTGSQLTASGGNAQVFLGKGGSTTATVSNGGSIALNGEANGARLSVAQEGGTATLNVQGAGSQVTADATAGANAQIRIGSDAGSDGTINVSDNASTRSESAVVGFSGGTGALNVTSNASVLLGGTAADSASMIVGSGADATGTVLVDDASVTLQVDPLAESDASLWVGAFGGAGDMTVQNGASVDLIGSQTTVDFGNGPFPRGSFVFVGGGLNNTPTPAAPSSLTVTGSGSSLTANGLLARGFVNNGATVSVNNGGSVTIGDATSAGASAVIGVIGSDGTLNVDGAGSEVRINAGAAASSDDAASLFVGSISGGSGIVDVDNGGQLVVESAPAGDSFSRIGGQNGSTGTVSIGQNSLFDAGEVLGISHDGMADNFSFDDGQVFLTDSTATLVADDVFIGQNGLLGGVGTVVGNVNVDGGTLAPGLSPGLLTINGDLSIGSGGTLDMEVGGYGRGNEFDAINAFTVTLGGMLNVALIDLNNGFLPTAGDTFDLIVADTIMGSFSSFNFASLAGGLVFSTQLIDGVAQDIYQLVVQQGSVGDGVPAPGAAALMLFGLAGLVARRRAA